MQIKMDTHTLLFFADNSKRKEIGEWERKKQKTKKEIERERGIASVSKEIGLRHVRCAYSELALACSPSLSPSLSFSSIWIKKKKEAIVPRKEERRNKYEGGG